MHRTQSDTNRSPLFEVAQISATELMSPEGNVSIINQTVARQVVLQGQKVTLYTTVISAMSGEKTHTKRSGSDNRGRCVNNRRT